MIHKPYENLDYIDDIYDLTSPGEEYFAKSIDDASHICKRLAEPMIYWRMRWLHRCAIAAAFIIGLSIGL